MPELPEVETIRRDLSARILNKEIVQVDVLHQKVVRPEAAAFTRQLVGKKFRKIDRLGKLLVFSLSGRLGRGDKGDRSSSRILFTKKTPPDFACLLVHLKMTGQLIYRVRRMLVAGGHSFSEPITKLPHRHTRVVIRFAGGSELFFNDMRLFGYLELASAARLAEVKKKFGIEPLTQSFTLEKFASALKGRRTSVKAVLLNQNLISGIGNIYADEICFRAGIRPQRRAYRLTGAEIRRLHRACETVLSLGIKHRGTTFNSFRDGNGGRGGFLKFLKVYSRAGERCKKCRRAVIQKVRAAGRGTHFCPTCQR